MYNFVTVMVMDAVNSSFFTQDASTGGATVPVSGLGDAAFKSPPTGSGCTVFVLKGLTFLRIDYFAAASDPHCPGVVDLARQAIGRVPS
jgi:hypothetical protein